MVHLQSKLNSAVHILEYFTSVHLEFSMDNFLMLKNEMSEQDNKVKISS